MTRYTNSASVSIPTTTTTQVGGFNTLSFTSYLTSPVSGLTVSGENTFTITQSGYYVFDVMMNGATGSNGIVINFFTPYYGASSVSDSNGIFGTRSFTLANSSTKAYITYNFDFSELESSTTVSIYVFAQIAYTMTAGNLSCQITRTWYQ